MSLEVGTGKAKQTNDLLTSLDRGRHDHEFFSETFLNRKPHDGQLEYLEGSDATINCLATANRWGKTTTLVHVHTHGCIYKTGGEPFYLSGEGLDVQKYMNLRYNTIHTADLWETAQLVWDDALKLRNESPILGAFIKDAPLSRPVKIDFINGSRWKFRTLGHDASGIDGNSFYIISIDEAGWINDLEVKMNNVIRVRVADVSGRIHIVGTFKPGVSRDFYKFCVRAGAYTGRALTFDHRTLDEEDEQSETQKLDSSIRSYLREFFKREAGRGKEFSEELAENLGKLGITPDEYAQAATGGS